ncbi:MAG: sugar phosphate nucleotidyltransferase, partial [Halobacteriovoraceae bacterium]|nr:sugar phosphate nucleotidyltransferase [Halobacteriovoraceae bacterium]
MKEWKEALLSKNSTVKDCIEKLNNLHTPIALVVDDSERLLGTVTDSDIRKAILKDIPLDSPVTEVMNTNPKIGKNYQSEEELDQFIIKLGFRHLPIVDENNRVVGLKELSEVHQKEELPNSVLILAGGLGSRLGELTKDCPKPMLTIEGVPLLEINIKKLKAQGFRKFYISVNYLSHIIENHLGDGSRLGVQIEYLHEENRLGTAGPITLLPESIQDPFLVLNGDIVTELNFSDLAYFHEIGQQDVTVCVRKHEFVIPYGVFDLEGTSVLKI